MCVCSYQLCLTSALQANNLLHVARFAAGPSAATTSQSSRPASFCGGWSSGSTCFHSQRQPPGCRIYTCHVLEPLLLETRWCYSRSYTQRPSSTQSSTTTPGKHHCTRQALHPCPHQGLSSWQCTRLVHKVVGLGLCVCGSAAHELRNNT